MNAFGLCVLLHTPSLTLRKGIQECRWPAPSPSNPLLIPSTPPPSPPRTQVRRQMDRFLGSEEAGSIRLEGAEGEVRGEHALAPLLRHGIFRERTAEMATDSASPLGPPAPLRPPPRSSNPLTHLHLLTHPPFTHTPHFTNPYPPLFSSRNPLPSLHPPLHHSPPPLPSLTLISPPSFSPLPRCPRSSPSPLHLPSRFIRPTSHTPLSPPSLSLFVSLCRRVHCYSSWRVTT